MIFFGLKIRLSKLFTITSFLFSILIFWQFYITHCFDLPALIGDRTESLLDLWSFQHLFVGILLGSILLRIKLFSLASWQELALTAFFLAICWEITELVMENGLFGMAIAHWKDGFEHWSNRMFSDPLMVTSGALIARSFSQSWEIILLPVIIWLLINLASPSSMYIQRLLFG